LANKGVPGFTYTSILKQCLHIKVRHLQSWQQNFEIEILSFYYPDPFKKRHDEEASGSSSASTSARGKSVT